MGARSKGRDCLGYSHWQGANKVTSRDPKQLSAIATSIVLTITIRIEFAVKNLQTLGGAKVS